MANRAAATAGPRDTTADQMRMMMLLTADWLNGDRTHSGEIASLLAHMLAALEPPRNVDAPYVSQDGPTLHCTMGNWDGEPTDYAYAWCVDGSANGAAGEDYLIAPEDAGHVVACVVTATNAVGSTAGPMSNGVAIPAEP